MPLGKISKVQISKGLEVLIDLEEALKNKQNAKLAELSSRFFTLIPHSFGRRTPPVLNTTEAIRQKKDVMITLSDIELTQSLQNVKKDPDEVHPLDMHYQSLGCDMKLLDPKSERFKLLQKYVAASASSWRQLRLVDVWDLDRSGEEARFAVNDSLDNRKLLWHGTSVAVVAAILNSGLRIMPHSGGRVGRGIYLASEYSKSAGYAGGHYAEFHGENETTFMFLSEVVLGKVHEIGQDNGSLRAAPKGFNSVVARGNTEPDPKKDVKIEFDGKTVSVPVGKPVEQKKWKDSYFSQSEYLVYNEHQVRLRYLLKFIR